MPKIAVIDDDRSQLAMMELFLKSQGWDYSGAANGAEGLTLIASRRPDIILLDVNLPDMTGLEICSRLKDDPATVGIPLMLISGDKKKAEDIIAGLSESRADAYMVKPVSLPLLKAKLDAMLKTLETK